MMKTATSLATTTQAYTLKYELLDVCVTCTEKMKKKKNKINGCVTLYIKTHSKSEQNKHGTLAIYTKLLCEFISYI